MSPSPSALRTQVGTLLEAGPVLWQAGARVRARWLASAFSALGGADLPLHQSALARLPESSGLSAEMVAWALESTLSTLSERALSELHASVPVPARASLARPGRLCVVVLAGNVFTAAARALALPLLFGVPVLAKTAADDAAFVASLQLALERADPRLARAFHYVEVASQDAALSQLLFEQADLVSAYGSDASLTAIRAQLGAGVSFIEHGHGLGAAFVDQGVLQDESTARAVAAQLALDVAAYDQRGCLSPLVAWVSAGQSVPGRDFARFVFEALAQLAIRLPRGPLPLAAAGAQLGFRGVAALRGTVLEGDGHCVTYEGAAPLRISPGYRNLQVLEVADASALPERLAPLGVHLKCLGIAGVADPGALIDALPARLAPRVCALGAMQRPHLDALQDGLPAWEGLLRYVERDL